MNFFGDLEKFSPFMHKLRATAYRLEVLDILGNKQAGGPGLFHKLPHFRFQLRVKSAQGFVLPPPFSPGSGGRSRRQRTRTSSKEGNDFEK